MDDNGEIRRSFEGYSIGIVTADQVFARMMEKALAARGGDVRIFKDGYGVVTYLKGKSSVLDAILVTGNIEQAGIKWILSRFRARTGLSLDVIWFIGDDAPEGVDGHTKRPFRPVDLLRPLHKLMEEKKEQTLRDLTISS